MSPPKPNEQCCGMLDGGICGLIKPGGELAQIYKILNKKIGMPVFWAILTVIVLPAILLGYRYTYSSVTRLDDEQKKIREAQSSLVTKQDMKDLKFDLLYEIRSLNGKHSNGPGE